MPKFLVVNVSEGQIHLEIPPHVDAMHLHFTQITLPHSQAVDLYPLTGSIAVCKRLSRLHGLEMQNQIRIEIED